MVAGFLIGRRLQLCLSDAALSSSDAAQEPAFRSSDAAQEPVFGSSDAAQELWDTLLGIIAGDRQKTSWRYADGIKTEELAFVIRDYIALDLGSSILLLRIAV